MKPKYLEFSGINSFARKAEIDFEKLLSGGIFGIFGDTGSGKTTILDSMIFALYGRIDRIKGGVGNEIINYNCDRAYVLFDFETETPQGRKVYRVEREIKRKNSAQSLTLSEVNGEQIKPVSDGVKNTNAKIQEIVGLSFEDFKKCIALPQGEFAQFVKAERSERLKLISRLFGLEKYGDLLNARIKERYSEVRSSFDTKEGELRAYGDLDGADLVAMQEECARLKAQKAQLDEEYNRFAADFEKFKDEYTRGRSLKEYKNALQVLQAREKEIGELRRLVGLALKAREICTLQRSGEQRKVKSAALERSRAAALAKKAASEAELARLREENEKANYAARAEEISAKLAALAYIKQDAESLRKKGEERERLKKEYQALQAAITKASGEAEECARREFRVLCREFRERAFGRRIPPPGRICGGKAGGAARQFLFRGRTLPLGGRRIVRTGSACERAPCDEQVQRRGKTARKFPPRTEGAERAERGFNEARRRAHPRGERGARIRSEKGADFRGRSAH